MICRIAFWLFAMLYALAFLLFVIGTLGLFSDEPESLAGIYLVMLGMPWVQFFGSVPDFLGVLAPAINLGLIALLCRMVSRR